jgi:hypothetical protein
MKRLSYFSAALVFLFAFGNLQAQEPVKKELKSEIKTAKKEIKTDRKTLHKLEGTRIPQRTKESFVSDFGNIPDVKWKRASYLDEAVFTKDGKEMKAYYDFFSKLVGTTQQKTFTDLPEKVQKEIKTKYKDYKIGEVVFFDDNEACESDMLLFDTQFEDADNYFVELTKGNMKQIVQVNTKGELFFFKELK